MRIPRRSRSVRVTARLLLVCGSLVGAELVFRGLQAFGVGVDERFLAASDRFGWQLSTEAPRHTGKNACGESVTNERYSDPLVVKTPRHLGATPIVFVGDSFTMARQVSSGSAYYDVVERLQGDALSVYAVGVDGFGTLQEYMALEEVYARIRPAAVIWQISGNDVENNVFELDSGSFYNNERPRPYLDLATGQISMRDPGTWLYERSAVYRFVFEKTRRLDSAYNIGILRRANRLIAPSPARRPVLERAGLRVLGELVRRAVESHPETSFVGWSVDLALDREFARVFEEAGGRYLPGVAGHVRAAGGTDCAPIDTHWNRKGHEVAGIYLNEKLEETQSAVVRVLERAVGTASLKRDVTAR